MQVKIGKHIAFWVYRRPCLIWSPVIAASEKNRSEFLPTVGSLFLARGGRHVVCWSSRVTFSVLIFSGSVMMQRYPLMAHASARPMPVFPDVGSINVSPGCTRTKTQKNKKKKRKNGEREKWTMEEEARKQRKNWQKRQDWPMEEEKYICRK